MAKRKATRKKIVKKNIARGIVHILASFNNTLVTVTDEMGNMIAWSSAGALGFKGSKKSTPFAAQQAVESAMEKAMVHGIKEVGIKVQGPGSGRETAVKSVGAIEGLRVSFMKDVTPLPHNGCRAPKRRRV
ncbi:MAG: 30S ribosomal protein S11 [Sulfuricurvum sp. GWF2_44_89]|jgi:small subunit ribosomal protein S11|uniref:Small ribosomal subunit protein uS11 n=2 Tax=Sulfuricurvum kujiense TaxID=148813 RepID=E4TX89_SULKY|nr:MULTISPECIES: 30S ribosomal protein S11 [Sulfuricurvum]OHD77757.1 MAG: 30S ribosomal protein S11 [Sulfuricurvum sp. GWF2_44_89]ADR34955.1 SSU ribosomal protein S11P [Sulfuricurvum kujiense DSM 16994]MDD5717257.1 30S ribosomal protein S11 [Sulfuricurvum sp.]OHD94887.1 MAG: 30S ribosomal protein S11 [Sulfuricurvum sp. RIFOXYD12_FULL_44_77]OHD95487.1 MAG: 30S ribosomal protein S11 [Sulfuricurvum sp. RIFOXYD2_FULL_44_160]